MKILKNKTLRKLMGEIGYYKSMHETGIELMTDLFHRFIPEQIELTRQEMILNWKETEKFQEELEEELVEIAKNKFRK